METAELNTNHPEIKGPSSRTEAFKPIMDQMDKTRSALVNKMLIRIQGERTLAGMYIENHSGEVRENALAILTEINSTQQPTVLDQYASMGLTFLPEDSNQTHPRIEAQTKLPRNPFPSDKPILTLIHDQFDRYLQNNYKTMHASGAHKIALFTYGSLERQSQVRGTMLSEVLLSGKLPRSETVKIHETAHCGNAFGFDYSEATIGLVSNLKYEMLSLRHTPSGNKMYEVHSMLAEYVLTGTSTRAELDSDSIQNVAVRAMLHPDVSGYESRGINQREITQMTKDLLNGKTENLPKWYLDEYEKTKEVLNNVLRTMTLEETLGKTGTYLGRQKNKDRMMVYKNGRFPNWEKRIVKRAKQKGIIPRRMKTREALEMIDQLTETTIDQLNGGALQVKFALQAGVVKSLSNEPRLSEVLGNTEDEVDDLIEKAKQLAK